MMTHEHVTKHLIRKVKRIKRKYGIKENKDIPGRIAEHQAEIKALAAQIRNKERKCSMMCNHSMIPPTHCID